MVAKAQAVHDTQVREVELAKLCCDIAEHLAIVGGALSVEVSVGGDAYAHTRCANQQLSQSTVVANDGIHLVGTFRFA